jgi:predicted O-linked N-acetylglucosamine transferase (SPINDLY family)
MTAASEAIETKFQQALDLHMQGQLGPAEALYQEILQAEPQHFHALHFLGVAAGQKGEAQVALDLIGRAIAINPNDAGAYANRGNALRDLNRYDEALTSYDRAIVIQPDAAEVLSNRGLVLQQLGRYEEALASFDRSLAIQPDSVELLDYRGMALFQLRRYDEALLSFDRAIAIQPRSVEILSHRAITLHRLRRFEDALAGFDGALAIQPDSAALLINRGPALQELGRFQEALTSYDRALAINPDTAEAHYNRGNILDLLKRYDDARVSYERALAIRPDYRFAFGSWLLDTLRGCDWSRLDSAFEQLAAGVDAGKTVTSPFVITATPLSLSQQRKAAESYVDAMYPGSTAVYSPQAKTPGDRIRVGYFSADFSDHPVAHLTAALFEHHDRKKFEVIAFSFGPPVRDAMRTRLESAFDQFIDVGNKTDREIAMLARAKGIDIAVDLMGFTLNSRTGIFAERAAPVQVNYLGYPGTMGADYMDYLIADLTVVSAIHAPQYREKIAYLPHTFQVNDSTRRISDRIPSRRELGLPEKGFIFCNFNNSYKLTPKDFDIWMRLLSKVPGSVLWLTGTSAAAEANLRKEAGARGVSPERLVFKKYAQLLEDHLAQIKLADLFLDSRYFNAHTTGSDSLWAGVPLLTRLGDTYASRVAASLLTAVGLPELIARSDQAYEALALELSTDAPKLAAIRERLAANRLTQPLFDTALFTRNIEAAYSAMTQRQRTGLPPRNILA